jgi:hypothetical protein
MAASLSRWLACLLLAACTSHRVPLPPGPIGGDYREPPPAEPAGPCDTDRAAFEAHLPEVDAKAEAAVAWLRCLDREVTRGTVLDPARLHDVLSCPPPWPDHPVASSAEWCVRAAELWPRLPVSPAMAREQGLANLDNLLRHSELFAGNDVAARALVARACELQAALRGPPVAVCQRTPP